jgi:hypothetical protein
MLRTVLSACMLLSIVAPLSAQSLRAKISELYTFGTCGQPLCLSVNPDHGSHYIPDAVQGNAAILQFVTDAIGQAVASVPISSASGGAVFTFEGGLPVRTDLSSGPIFGERAQTLGRGRFFVGANVSSIRLQSLRGAPLSNIVMNFTHENVGSPVMGDPIYENDVIEVQTSMNVDLLVSTIFASLGIGEGLDIGVAVPLVRTSLSGTSRAQLYPWGAETPHMFGTASNPSMMAHSDAYGTATGVGDVAVRMKARLSGSAPVGYGILAEARLPTGDEEDLLGSGHLAVRALGIVSARLGDFSPHANVGYLHRTGESQMSALLATVGFDQLIAPRATFALDLVSEWQMGDGLVLPGEVVIEAPYERRIRHSNIPSGKDHLVNLSVGAKLGVSDGMNAVVNSFVPLNVGGMRPNATWTAGLEYSF